jgi:hypothetical protein
MVKKAKAKQAKTKKAKSRRSTAGAVLVTPTYLPAGKTYTIGLDGVVQVLKVIEKHGYLAKFFRAARAQEVTDTFDAKAVNFVKGFMAKHKMHNDPIACKQRDLITLSAASNGVFSDIKRKTA